MKSKQISINISEKKDEVKLDGEDLDKALYDVMNTLWKSYRESVIEQKFLPYNNAFPVLYKKYSDKTVVRFIEGFGMGMVNALNRRIKNG